ncbi:UNVERIFIED_CONTAM: Lupeol synthase [Sesamum radiatum]|uniref:Lupeol synthase n=1 Tax=Sesamum radiatum TaxID=300843 RepID=A0AAW2KN71_SESRA
MWRLKIAEGGGAWLTTTNDHIGRQHWEFDAEAGTPEERAEVERMREEFNKNRFRFKQSADLFMRMQLRKENGCGPMIPAAIKVQGVEEITEDAILTTLRRGISYYSSMQAHDGHWPAESAGPLFSVPPLNEDGGWGLHIEGHSTMFGSILNYVALRLLGEDGEDGPNGPMASARKWILDHGGAVAIPSWGKFWLAVLGVYEWDGCNPMPPEFWNHVVLLSLGIYANVILVWKKEDLYYPHPFIQDVLWGFLHYFVEVLCLLACWVEDPNSDAYKNHLARLPDFYWVAEDGMKIQVLDNPPGDFHKMYRQICKGAWTFVTRDQGWQVSDCTAEGLKAALLLSQMPPELVGDEMEIERLYDAVNVVLSLQSANGGLSAWEPVRAQRWLEKLNPTELFEDAFIEKEHVECTSSAIQALNLFKKLHPTHRPEEIESCISRAMKYIENTQGYDGSCGGVGGMWEELP